MPEAGGGTVVPESRAGAAVVVKHDGEHDQDEQRGRTAGENALGRHRVDATARHGAQTSRASAAQGRRSYGCAVSAERPLSDELVIVANRLPVVRADDGSWEVSPGGLVSALAPIVQAGRGSWIGWAGIPGAPPKAFDHGGMRLTPIGLNAREIEGFYEGFANRTLWPLYHDAVRPPEFRREWWQSYVETNQRFAELTAKVASPGATVWVHDYQLHLVPALLRALRPDLRIGFFLHIPLPPQELFMQLPWRQQIVEGMLGRRPRRLPAAGGGAELPADRPPARRRPPRARADPVSGAHGARRARSRSRSTSARSTPSRRCPRPRAPPGSCARHWARRAGSCSASTGSTTPRASTCACRPSASCSQSGVTTAGETVLVQVATPSRERVTTYRQLRERVERAVGRINGEFGRLGHPAIHYQHHNLPREELCALYAAADVMLVTPLRDGMNLVCKEYVAARHRGGGVLVLSEFAGAAGELRQALLVQPARRRRHARDDRAGDLAARRRGAPAHARDAPPGAHARRAPLRAQRSSKRSRRTPSERRVQRTATATAARSSRRSRALAREPHLLVACDYDGTLAPIVDVPGDARPQRESVAALRALAALAETSVAVISGRSLHDLAALSRLPEEIHLVGSHGTEFDVGFARALAPEALALRDRVTDELHAIAATQPGRDASSSSRPARRCTTGRPPRRTARPHARPCARARRSCPACTRARASR